jgi:hypothetical protein
MWCGWRRSPTSNMSANQRLGTTSHDQNSLEPPNMSAAHPDENLDALNFTFSPAELNAFGKSWN